MTTFHHITIVFNPYVLKTICFFLVKLIYQENIVHLPNAFHLQRESTQKIQTSATKMPFMLYSRVCKNILCRLVDCRS